MVNGLNCNFELDEAGNLIRDYYLSDPDTAALGRAISYNNFNKPREIHASLGDQAIYTNFVNDADNCGCEPGRNIWPLGQHPNFKLWMLPAHLGESP